MPKPSTQRFVVWAGLVSLGWLSLLWIDRFGLLFFFAAWFVAMPRERLHRVVPRRELLWIACILIAFVVVVVASKILTPASGDGAPERLFRHPTVIIILWLLCLGLGFRGWRRRIHNAA